MATPGISGTAIRWILVGCLAGMTMAGGGRIGFEVEVTDIRVPCGTGRCDSERNCVDNRCVSRACGGQSCDAGEYCLVTTCTPCPEGSGDCQSVEVGFDCRCHDGLYAWTLGRAVAPQLFPVQLWSPTVGSAYVSVVTIET